MTSRPQMIINVLQANPGQQFTARQLAQKIIDRYSAELAEKRKNPRFVSDEAFLSQITAEVGGSRTVKAKAMCPQVMTRDKPRPRLFYWGSLWLHRRMLMWPPNQQLKLLALPSIRYIQS
ncbi:Uncharacterized protein conserved in bacteria [Klebsiella grimontii]|uniref:Uncharacterized protein conserved in bacteria n=1 Tax=Klebsiella grimontii TaxID=2058152 RepID=A0A7H4PB58_9ENTR|nr:Uncharacterized protein conserved in bacteria [Klebsiella grimontii]